MQELKFVQIAFLIDRYEESMQIRTVKFSQLALQTRDKILAEYVDLLEQPNRSKYIPVLQSIIAETLSVTDFKVPGWSSSERLVELNNLFKELKNQSKKFRNVIFFQSHQKLRTLK